jgi:hypothetical protein
VANPCSRRLLKNAGNRLLARAAQKWRAVFFNNLPSRDREGAGAGYSFSIDLSIVIRATLYVVD